MPDPSKLSNAKETQDTLQDFQVFNSYIHYIAKESGGEGDSDEAGEDLGGADGDLGEGSSDAAGTKAYEIKYAENFKKVTSLFDKYSDFYVDKDDFNIKGELGKNAEEDETVVGDADDEGVDVE